MDLFKSSRTTVLVLLLSVSCSRNLLNGDETANQGHSNIANGDGKDKPTEAEISSGKQTEDEDKEPQRPKDCKGWGACSQECQTIQVESDEGTFTSTNCYCRVGYHLADDNFTCLIKSDEDTILYYVTDYEIHQVNLAGVTKDSTPPDQNLLKTANEIVTFDIDINRNALYVVENGTYMGRDIYRYNINQDEETERKLIVNEGDDIGDLAIDWIGENIYWISDRGIFVATLEGYYRRTLVNGTFDGPMFIVVDPHMAVLFWTDRSNSGKIRRLSMSGGEITVTSSIEFEEQSQFTFYPTLDLEDRRLYFSFPSGNDVHTSNYTGHEYRKITKLPPTEEEYQISLAILTNYLYWQAAPAIKPFKVIRANKWRGDGELRIGVTEHPRDIKIWHSYKQPDLTPSPCAKKCEKLCLLYRNASLKNPIGLCKSSDPNVTGPPPTEPAPLLGPAAIASLSTAFAILIFTILGIILYRKTKKRKSFNIDQKKGKRDQE